MQDGIPQHKSGTYKRLQEKTVLWQPFFSFSLLLWISLTYFRHLIEARKYLCSTFFWSQCKENKQLSMTNKSLTFLSLLLSSMLFMFVKALQGAVTSTSASTAVYISHHGMYVSLFLF